MDLAVLEQKNLVSAWRQVQNHQRKNRKRSGTADKKSKQEKNDFEDKNQPLGALLEPSLQSVFFLIFQKISQKKLKISKNL